MAADTHPVRYALPASIAWAVLVGLCAVLGWRGTTASAGEFTYALDDAYIHMAMARSLVEHGVWGPTPDAFASASSSPLWTALLAAGFAVFGVHSMLPLLVDLLLAFVVLLGANRLVLPELEPRMRTGLLITLALVTPLAPLILGGMEHVLQIAVVLPFVLGTTAALAGDRAGPRLLAATAPLLLLTRYESMFLVFAAVSLLIAHRKPWVAAVVSVLAVAPPLVFGLVSVRNGWDALPSPVLLKGQVAAIESPLDLIPVVLGKGPSALFDAPHLLVLVLVNLVLVIRREARGEASPKARQIAFLFTLTTVLHVLYASAGWFYRYEAWLVALGVISTALLAARDLPHVTTEFERLEPIQLAVIAAVCVLGWPLATRAASAVSDVPRAMRNIHDQQRQLARFLNANPDLSPVAINDIGAISWYTQADYVDLWGLATLEVSRHRRHGTYGADVIDELTTEHGARAAIFYEKWFEPVGIPAHWRKVGEWTIADNVVCGDATVSFWATTPDPDPLRAALRNFAAEGVAVRILD